MSREVRGAQEPRGIRRFVPRANTCALYPEPRLSSGGDVGISLTGRTYEHLRNHARTLDASGAVIPYKAERELPATTHLRARAQYPTLYLPAYTHSRLNGGTPFSYVENEVHSAMHRPITRLWIPARGGLRIPAESQSAPSARSLPGIRITIVSRPHAPSIIVPWQGSGRRSVSGQPLRHDGDRRTA